MSKRRKRLERLRRNPKSATFDDVRSVMEDFGFILERSSGSHFNFRVEVKEQVWKITIPFRKPHIKETYVKELLTIIDEIIELQAESEDDGD